LNIWKFVVGSLRLRECSLDEDRVFASSGIARLTRPPHVLSDDIFGEVAGMTPAQIYAWMSGLFLTRSGDLDCPVHRAPGSTALRAVHR